MGARSKVLALLASLTLLAAGCGGEADDGEEASPAPWG